MDFSALEALSHSPQNLVIAGFESHVKQRDAGSVNRLKFSRGLAENVPGVRVKRDLLQAGKEFMGQLAEFYQGAGGHNKGVLGQ